MDHLDVSTGVDGYTSVEGSFTSKTSSQTTTLTVGGPQNDADATYECIVESTEYDKPAETTAVHLKVFGECIPSPG